MQDQYVQTFYLNVGGRVRVYYIHPKPEWRSAHCKKCNILLPRDIPRIRIWRSYYDWSGNYCLPCGLKFLKEHTDSIKMSIADLQKNIRECEAIDEQAHRTMGTKTYHDIMDMLVFMHKVNGGEKL